MNQMVGLRRGRRFLFAPTNTPVLPNPDYGRDGRVWMQKTTGSGGDAPGGILYLPPGSYYAGDLGNLVGSAYAHAFDNTKPYKGWLILKAWQPGTVIWDLSNTAGGFPITDAANGGALNGGSINDNTGVESLRILFDDITFVNGVVRFCGTDRIRWWNCRNTYPRGLFDGSTPGSWQAQFNAVCTATSVAVTNAPPDTATYRTVRDHAYMKHNGSAPSGLRFDESFDHHKCTNIWAMGCDIHDITDDGIFSQGVHTPGAITGMYSRFVGMKIWNIFNANDRTVGPGGTYGGTGPPVWYHNNPIQTNGAEFLLWIADSILAGQIQFSSQFSTIDYVDWDRILNCGSPSSGMVLDASFNTLGPHGHIGGSTDRFGAASYYNWFANGQGPPYDSGGDNAALVLGSPSTPYTFVHSTPASAIVSGGLLTNLATVLADPTLAPNLWRAANFDRDTYLAGTWD